MCESKISNRCTGARDFKLGDGREVCSSCVTCCTSGLAREEPERIRTDFVTKTTDLPLSSDDAYGRPHGLRFD